MAGAYQSGQPVYVKLTIEAVVRLPSGASTEDLVVRADTGRLRVGYAADAEDDLEPHEAAEVVEFETIHARRAQNYRERR